MFKKHWEKLAQIKQDARNLGLISGNCLTYSQYFFAKKNQCFLYLSLNQPHPPTPHLGSHGSLGQNWDSVGGVADCK